MVLYTHRKRVRPSISRDIARIARDEAKRVLGANVYRDGARLLTDLGFGGSRKRKLQAAARKRKARRTGVLRVLARIPATRTRPLPVRARRRHRIPLRMPFRRRYARRKRRYTRRRRVTRKRPYRRRRVVVDPIRSLANRNRRIVHWWCKWEDRSLASTAADLPAANYQASTVLPYVTVNQAGDLYSGSWNPTGGKGYMQAQFYTQYAAFFEKYRVISYTLRCRIYNMSSDQLFCALHSKEVDDVNKPTTATTMEEIQRRRHTGNYRIAAAANEDNASGNYCDLAFTRMDPMRSGDAAQREEENYEVDISGTPNNDTPTMKHIIHLYMKKINPSKSVVAGEILVRWSWHATVLLSKPVNIAMG